MKAEMMMQATGGDLALALLTPEAALGDPDLLVAWRARLGGVHRANRLFASPEWFENRWRSLPRGRDAAGSPAGRGRGAARLLPAGHQALLR